MVKLSGKTQKDTNKHQWARQVKSLQNRFVAWPFVRGLLRQTQVFRGLGAGPCSVFAFEGTGMLRPEGKHDEEPIAEVMLANGIKNRLASHKPKHPAKPIKYQGVTGIIAKQTKYQINNRTRKRPEKDPAEAVRIVGSPGMKTAPFLSVFWTLNGFCARRSGEENLQGQPRRTTFLDLLGNPKGPKGGPLRTASFLIVFLFL